MKESKGFTALDIAGAKYDICHWYHFLCAARFLSENIEINSYPDGMVFLGCF